MPPHEYERPPHAIPLSEYPKVGDVVLCRDDGDLGLVVSTSTVGPEGRIDPVMDLFVEVQWRDAGLCTDGWGAKSFNTYDPLYEIVSRA